MEKGWGGLPRTLLILVLVLEDGSEGTASPVFRQGKQVVAWGEGVGSGS